MYLIFQVSLHDHLIEALCELMGGRSLWHVTLLIRLVTINIVIVEIQVEIFVA